ncbi:MAG: imidazoleglycerol-phosphate dehydratase HisB [Bacteroidales bacterium]|jgi:imidazoleglycerol-phosphate dehydratase/histidinol-phosphatase
MNKVIFIKRDGPLVTDARLPRFCPQVFQWLARVSAELDYQLVMVTDGVPDPVEQQTVISCFENEGVVFQDVLTELPGTGESNKYLYGFYQLDRSFIISDDSRDIAWADQQKIPGIYMGKSNKTAVLCATEWSEIFRYLKAVPRKVVVNRKTRETDVRLTLNLDGSGRSRLGTGLGFLDHMLEQIVKHGKLDLDMTVKGDLETDQHHTMEDVALALGEAFKKALGSKKGIGRYGFVIPMDDSLAQVAVDFGGRPYLVWDVDLKREMIGDVPCEMFKHFFRSFCDAAGCNLNVRSEGENDHHKVEAVFKAFGKSVAMATAKTSDHDIPSTKGVL